MSIKKLVGIALLCLPFIAIIVFGVIMAGILPIGAAVVASFLIYICILYGVKWGVLNE